MSEYIIILKKSDNKKHYKIMEERINEVDKLDLSCLD